MEITIDDESFERVEVCLLAGKVMLESGAETYRVEDTMSRIADALGLPHSHSYVTPTVIMFATESKDIAKLIRITNRTIDLEKVATVNSISRNLTGGIITAEEAFQQLKKVEAAKHTYPIWMQIAASAISSGCFTIMFKGGWIDFIPAMICGGLGFTSFVYLQRLLGIKLFAELTASFFIGLFAFILTFVGFGKEANKIIIGSVMPLVPGLLITNAVRDLMAGHLVSGMSKGAEAFLTAFAIGTGIALVFTIL
ncbi:threonine/serine exporter [Paenibacillus albiflavus]|uniref:Threonine/serine exporter n=1 Tax=Paenibacillus albiflavus TaxID=2545760 RepID=A0A4R4E6Q6_9BACL|nr:threonine/serine exporter family protein [Paenibacillus albiflavus]TCZ75404.1 threonine/serine exporter [Paenibacillus albiflavus]